MHCIVNGLLGGVTFNIYIYIKTLSGGVQDYNKYRLVFTYVKFSRQRRNLPTTNEHGDGKHFGTQDGLGKQQFAR